MTPAKPASTGRTLPLGWSGAEASPPQRPGGTPADPEPAAGRSRARTRLALLGALAMLLVLVLLLPRLLVGGTDPGQIVRAHLDALVAGDVSTVREHLDTSRDASDAALSPAVLQAAEERVTGFTIDDVQQSGHRATVTATLHLGSTSQQATYTVSADPAGPFARPDWHLDPVPTAVYAVTVPNRVEQLLLNGVALPLAELSARPTSYDQQVVSLRLLPGTYALTLPVGGALLDPVVETLEVPVPGSTAQRTGAVLAYDLSDEGRSRVLSRIDAELEDCTLTRVDGAAVREVTLPAAFEIIHHVGSTWTIVSAPGQALVATDPDGSGASREVPFLLRGTAVLDASGTLHTSLTCADGS